MLAGFDMKTNIREGADPMTGNKFLTTTGIDMEERKILQHSISSHQKELSQNLDRFVTSEGALLPKKSQRQLSSSASHLVNSGLGRGAQTFLLSNFFPFQAFSFIQINR